MAERPPSGGDHRRDEPDFDWLYGTKRPGVGSGTPPEDPEPTRVLPTIDRPSGQERRLTPPSPARASSAPPSTPVRPRVRPVDPPPPPRARHRHPIRWVVAVLAIWLVYLVAVPVWAWQRVDKVPDNPGHRPASQAGTTYLLVGSDSRKGLTRRQELRFGVGRGSGRRTDTIMVLHTGAGPNLLMSIPRDSLVDIPGHGTQKINAAFAFGGPRLLIRTVEADTGIRIDDYVEIGFAGFVDLVDAVGGIQICPTQRMDDPLANLHIKKGCQHVHGKVALGYARSRHVSALGDIDRALHQREVVSAVGHAAVSPWSVLNPIRYFKLAKAASSSLRVGKHTSLLATARFALAMTRVNDKTGLTCGVPISDLAVHWDASRADRLFKLIADDQTANIPKSLCTPSGLKS